LCGDDTTLAEGAVEKLKVRLLEEGLSGTLWVAGVGDDDVELALLVLEELETVADDGLGLGVLEADRHAGKVLLREADDGLVNVAENGLLDTVVLDDLTEDTAVTTADNENLLGVGVGVHGKVSDHLLVAMPMSASHSSAVCIVTYENSSRSVHWMTLSRTRTMP
jgi:hypothetical protein